MDVPNGTYGLETRKYMYPETKALISCWRIEANPMELPQPFRGEWNAVRSGINEDGLLHYPSSLVFEIQVDDGQAHVRVGRLTVVKNKCVCASVPLRWVDRLWGMMPFRVLRRSRDEQPVNPLGMPADGRMPSG